MSTAPRMPISMRRGRWCWPAGASMRRSSPRTADGWAWRSSRPRRSPSAPGPPLPSDVNPPGTWVAGSGRMLVGGNWATTPPYVVNPGYFSPRAEWELFEASADRRWTDITRTQRVLGWQLIGTGMLPPDWATVSEVGHAVPTGPVTGGAPYASVSTPRAYQSGSQNPAIERTEPSRVRCAPSSQRRVKFPRCAT